MELVERRAVGTFAARIGGSLDLRATLAHDRGAYIVAHGLQRVGGLGARLRLHLRGGFAQAGERRGGMLAIEAEHFLDEIAFAAGLHLAQVVDDLRVEQWLVVALRWRWLFGAALRQRQ